MAEKYQVYSAEIKLEIKDLATDALVDIEKSISSMVKNTTPLIENFADVLNRVSSSLDKISISGEIYRDFDKLQDKFSSLKNEFDSVNDQVRHYEDVNWQLRDSLREVNDELERTRGNLTQTTNFWDDIGAEVKSADTSYDKFGETIDKISNKLERLDEDFRRRISAGSSGRAFGQVSQEDIGKIILRLREETQDLTKDSGIDAFENAIRNTAAYFGKDLEFMVSVLTKNKYAFKSEWGDMAETGIGAMQFLYDKLVYHSIIPDGNTKILSNFESMFGQLKVIIDQSTKHIYNSFTDANKAVDKSIDKLKTNIALAKHSVDLLNRNERFGIVGEEHEKRVALITKAYDELQVKPIDPVPSINDVEGELDKVEIKYNQRLQEMAARAKVVYSEVFRQINDETRSLAEEALFDWGNRGAIAGKTFFRTLIDEGDEAAEKIRQQSIEALKPYTDDQGFLTLFRAVRTGKDIKSAAESFSLSPMGAVLGAVVSAEDKSLGVVERIAEVKVHLNDVLASFNTFGSELGTRFGYQQEVIADLSKSLVDLKEASASGKAKLANFKEGMIEITDVSGNLEKVLQIVRESGIRPTSEQIDQFGRILNLAGLSAQDTAKYVGELKKMQDKLPQSASDALEAESSFSKSVESITNKTTAALGPLDSFIIGVKRSLDTVTTNIRSVTSVHAKALIDIFDDYRKRESQIDSGIIENIGVRELPSIATAGYSQEVADSFQVEADKATEKIKEILGTEQVNLNDALDQWTWEGVSEGKVMFRAMLEAGDETALAIRESTVRALSGLADASGKIKLYRAQAAGRSGLFALGESFSTSPFGATVGGAYGAMSASDLKGIDHIIEVQLDLQDVLAAVGAEQAKGMAGAGHTAEVLVDLTSVIKDLQGVAGLKVDYSELLPDRVKIIKIDGDLEKFTGSLQHLFNIVESGTDIKMLPEETIRGIDALIEDTVKLIPDIKDVESVSKKAGEALWNMAADPAASFATLTQEIGLSTTAVVKLASDLSKMLITREALGATTQSNQRVGRTEELDDKLQSDMGRLEQRLSDLQELGPKFRDAISNLIPPSGGGGGGEDGGGEDGLGSISPLIPDPDELRNRLNEIRAIAKTTFTNIPDTFKADIKKLNYDLTDFTKLAHTAISRLKSELSAIDAGEEVDISDSLKIYVDAIKNIQALITQANARDFSLVNLEDVAKASGRLDELNKRTDTLKDSIKELGVLSGAKERFDLVDASDNVALIQNVRDEVQALYLNVHDVISGSGLTRLTGLRNLFFGVGESSNFAAQALDKFVGFFHNASSAENDFAAAAELTAEQMRSQTGTLRNMTDNFIEVAAQSGITKREFTDLAAEVDTLQNKWAVLAGGIRASGQIAPRSVEVVAERVAILRQEFENLRNQEVLITPEARASFEELEQYLNAQERALILVRQRMYEAEKAAAGFENSIFSMSGLMERTAFLIQKSWAGVLTLILAFTTGGFAKVFLVVKSFAQNVIGSFSNLSNILVGHSIVPDMIMAIADWFIRLPGMVAGSIGKVFNLITSPFRKAFAFIKDGFNDFFRNITWTISLDNILQEAIFKLQEFGREFFEVNNLIQNTEVTLRGMLTSMEDIDADKAIAGFFDFVEEEAAKTPFEISEVIEQASRLISFSFDPQEWLRPVLNAAAAIGKPMDQLTNAMLKLSTSTATAMGDAVMQLREFGINTQLASSYVDVTTKKVLSLAQALEASKLSSQDLNERGWKLISFEAERAAGNVSNAQLALQGYLVQDARFANAAEARSKTFAGILSNLNDLTQQLLASLGGPIIQALTDVFGELYDEATSSQEQLEAWANVVGEYVADAIYKAKDVYDSFLASLSAFEDEFQTLVAFAYSIFRGDWQSAWNILVDITNDALSYTLDLLNDYLPQAVDWGMEFVSMIAEGIMDAASWVLRNAVSTIGDVISSFLEPGSPPEEGALSTIDKWGQGLVDTFLSSFTDADFSIIEDVTDRIKDLFQTDTSFDIVGFKGVRDQVIQLIAGINETGQVNDELFQSILNNMSGASEATKEYLKSQIALKQIQKEVSDAEKAGFIPEELKKKLNTAEQLVKFKEQDMKLEDELASKQEKAQAAAERGTSTSSSNDYKEKYNEEKDFIEKKKALGLLSEEEYLSALSRLEESYVDSAIKAGESEGLEQRVQLIKDYNARIDVLKEQQKTKDKASAEDLYNTEVGLLKKKYDLGLITHEEYVQGLLRAEEKYVEDSLENGTGAGLENHIRKIKELKGELDLFNEKESKLPSDVFNKETKLLEQRFSLGLITEQNYLAERVKLHQNYIDDIVDNQLNGSDEEKEILEGGLENFIKVQTAEIVALQQKQEELATPIADATTTESVFKNMENRVGDLQKTINTELTGFWSGVTDTINQASGTFSTDLGAKFQELIGSVKNEILGEGGGIGENIKGFFQPLIDAANWFNTTGQPMIVKWFDTATVKAEEAKNALDSIWGFFFGSETEDSGILKLWNGFVDSVKQWIAGSGLALLAYFPLVAAQLQPIIRLLNIAWTAIKERFISVIIVWLDKLGPVVQGIVNLFARILAMPLPEILAQIANWFGKLFTAVSKFLSVGTIFWTLFVIGIIENKDKLAAIFDDLISRLGSLFTNISRLFSLDGAAGGIGQIVSSIGTYISNMFNAIFDLFQGGLFSSIGVFFGGIFDIIYGSIQQVLGWINVAVGLVALLTGNFDLAKDSFKDAWETFRAAFENIAGSLPQMLSGVLSLIPDIILSTLATIADLIGLHGVAEWIRRIRDNIHLAITGFFTDLKNQTVGFVAGLFGSENFTAFQTFITELFSNIGLIDFFNRFKNDLGPAFVQLGEAFGRLGAALGELFTEIGIKLAPLFEKLGVIFAKILENIPLWELLLQLLKPLAILIGGVLLTALALLTGLIDGLASALLTSIEGITLFIEGIAMIVTGITNMITGVVTVITGFLSGDMTKVQEGLSIWSQGFLEFFGGIGTSVVGLFKTTLGALIDFVWGFVEGFLAPFQALYDTLVGHSIIPDLVSAVIFNFEWLRDNVLRVVRETIFGVIDLFDDIFEKIAGTKFVDAGRKLINYIGEGIESSKDSIRSSVEEVANDIWDYFDFGSPAKVGPLSREIKWNNYFTDDLDSDLMTSKFTEIGDRIILIFERAADRIVEILTGINTKVDTASPVTSENAVGASAPLSAMSARYQGLANQYKSMNQVFVDSSKQTTSAMLGELFVQETAIKSKFALEQAVEQQKILNTQSSILQIGAITQGAANNEIQTQLTVAQNAEALRYQGLASAYNTSNQTKEVVNNSYEQMASAAETSHNRMTESFNRMSENQQNGAQRLKDYFANVANSMANSWADFFDRLSEVGSISMYGDHNSNSGFGGSYAEGAWRIPHDMMAFIHKDEMIIPAKISDNIRGLLSSVAAAGIGAESLNIKPGAFNQSPTSNASQVQYNFEAGAFAGAFPNVKTQRDASGVITEIEKLVHLSTLRGSVV